MSGENRIRDLEIENKMLREALEFCSYDNKYIGSFNCKVQALKKIRAKAKKTLSQLKNPTKIGN